MLFQKNIVKKYIGLLDEKLITKAWDIRDRRVSFPPVDYVLELIPLSS